MNSTEIALCKHLLTTEELKKRLRHTGYIVRDSVAFQGALDVSYPALWGDSTVVILDRVRDDTVGSKINVYLEPHRTLACFEDVKPTYTLPCNHDVVDFFLSTIGTPSPRSPSFTRNIAIVERWLEEAGYKTSLDWLQTTAYLDCSLGKDFFIVLEMVGENEIGVYHDIEHGLAPFSRSAPDTTLPMDKPTVVEFVNRLVQGRTLPTITVTEIYAAD